MELTASVVSSFPTNRAASQPAVQHHGSALRDRLHKEAERHKYPSPKVGPGYLLDKLYKNSRLTGFTAFTVEKQLAKVSSPPLNNTAVVHLQKGNSRSAPHLISLLDKRQFLQLFLHMRSSFKNKCLQMLLEVTDRPV